MNKIIFNLDITSYQALNESTTKFINRFKKIKKEFNSTNINMKDLSLDDIDIIWNQNKSN